MEEFRFEEFFVRTFAFCKTFLQLQEILASADSSSPNFCICNKSSNGDDPFFFINGEGLFGVFGDFFLAVALKICRIPDLIKV